MRALCLLLLVGCTTTRQLARPTDPRLRAPLGGNGIVVPTTTHWKARVDPFTTLRLRSTDGAWSQEIKSSDARVDDRGVWLDGGEPELARYADAIELAGAPAELVAILEETRTREAELAFEGETIVMRAAPQVLQIWLVAIEDAITKRGQQLERAIRSRRPRGSRNIPLAEAGAIYDLRIGTVRVHTPQLGWAAPVFDAQLHTALGVRTPSRVGWPWAQVAAVEARNLSGGKTLAAIIGTVAVSVVVVPVLLLARGAPLAQGRTPSSGAASQSAIDTVARIGASSGGQPLGAWEPEPAPIESLRARPLFGDAAVARALLRGTLALDGFAAKTGDLAGTGVVAKLRLAQVFEIGGGVRVVGSRDERGWRRSVTHVFAMGRHRVATSASIDGSNTADLRDICPPVPVFGVANRQSR